MKLGLVFLMGLTMFSACFPEDELYEPRPIEGMVGEINQLIYDYQTFYSLNRNEETGFNPNDAWDLGFETGAAGEHIILNSGGLLSIFNLGEIDFEESFDIPTDANWIYDASSGNKDSLAIKDWVNTSSTSYIYSHDVYVIQKNREPFKKFKIIALSDSSYTLVVSLLELFNPDTVLVLKDNTINHVKLSLQNNNELVPIEPLAGDWDLQFTTYQSIIPDDDGVPTPYVVRGVLQNPLYTSVALYYISNDQVPERDQSQKDQEELELENYFLSITKDQVEDLEYSTNLDAVGYDWKDVVIDFEGGTAVYAANMRNIYIIRTQDHQLYKLRFISYYSGSAQKGYPTIHYLLLE